MMHTKKLLVASLSHEEAITQIVLNNKSAFEVPIDVLTIDTILNEYQIFDELTDRGAHIRWFKNNRIEISNHSHSLLNRVLCIPDTLFKNFHPDDSVYAKHEFSAYLGFAFNAFQGVDNLHPCGVCAAPRSLPQQWKLAASLNLSVPSYYWGSALRHGHQKSTQRYTEKTAISPHHTHQETIAQATKPSKFSPTIDTNQYHKPSLVYSDIYDFLNWSNPVPPSQTSPIFCFEKPLGYPVFLTLIGTQIFAPEVAHLPNKLTQCLFTQCHNMAQLSQQFIGEFLFFIHKNQYVFACFNPEIIRSRHYPGFERFVLSHLVPEVKKCLY